MSGSSQAHVGSAADSCLRVPRLVEGLDLSYMLEAQAGLGLEILLVLFW